MATRVLNVDRLKRKLALIPKEAEIKIRVALIDGAEEIVAFAKRLVPVDSGKLRDSIGWQWGDEAPEGAIVLATAKRQGLSLVVFAGNSKAFYARWVEFGTVKTRAQPFFFPAYRSLRNGVKRKISAVVRRSLREIASRG